MKKILLIGAAAFALALGAPVATVVNSNVATVVEAQTEIDFEQGSKSDEEYLTHIIDQFNELEAIESVTTSMGEGQESTSTMLVDLTSGAAKLETTIPPVTEGSQEYNMISYLFEDGSMVADEVIYLEMMTDTYSSVDPEFETKLQAVKDQMAGRLVLTPPLEGMEDSFEAELGQAYSTEGLVFSEVTKEGDTVRGTLDMDAYFEAVPEAKESLALFPEETVYQVAYEVNAAEQTLTSITNIDVPEQEETESESDVEGISVAGLMTDSEIRVVARPSAEKIPALEELDTLSREEFEQIVTDAGIEAY